MSSFYTESYIVNIFVNNIQKYLPDFIIRFILKIAIYLQSFIYTSSTSHEDNIINTIANLNRVTFETDEANKQHYEVPTDFFINHLGPQLKYSSCHWSEYDTIRDAEENTILRYQKELKLDKLEDNSYILEIGNGWGSLTLSNALKYKNLNFRSFSNSSTQIEYINSQIKKYNITNLEVQKLDIDDFVRSNKYNNIKFSRVVSIECIEHAKGYGKLFKKISNILTNDGYCFFQIISNRRNSYIMTHDTWIGKYFFSGGIIPHVNLFNHFDKDLKVIKTEIINGKEYSKTLDYWLNTMYYNKNRINKIFNDDVMFQKWRMFYLMCSEAFKSLNGNNYVITYITMNKTI